MKRFPLSCGLTVYENNELILFDVDRLKLHNQRLPGGILPESCSDKSHWIPLNRDLCELLTPH